MNAIQRIAVIGAGTMGRGIVQLFAQAGYQVRCYDAAPGAAGQAIEFVAGMIERAVTKGRYSPAQGAAVVARLQACEHLEQLAGCELAIEAVIEDLAVKRQLFQRLEAVLGDAALLASNTSSLMVAEIAAACANPERVAGLHFFNPVPLMKVVEVIAAVRTSAATVSRLEALVQTTGHRAVVAADQPGFLVNHAGRGLYTEGLRLLEEGVAEVAAIDRLLREAVGFRMGPFELLDLTGLDVSCKVMETIYQQFQQEPRFRPSSLVAPRIAAGLFGRKSGAGWYSYVDGERQQDEEQRVPELPTSLRVWVDPAADEYARLGGLVFEAGLELVESVHDADLLLLQFWGWDVSRYCAEYGLDASRAVAVDPLPGLDNHRSLMLSSVTRAEVRDAAHALLAQDGTAVTLLGDSCGFVLQRVLATIVNIAAEIAQRGIARVADLEDAVRLGLGYPLGPLQWGDAIGASRVLDILSRMHALSGDPRYRPSPWLARRAALELPLNTPEAART